MKNFLFIIITAILCMGSSCEKIFTPALPDSTGVPSINKEIKEANTNAQAALDASMLKFVALSNQAAIAAAQVDSARIANTNQPPSVATDIVRKETTLALGNLPPPNDAAALEAEKRRTAMLTGHIEEAKKLYAAAQNETGKMKVENEKLRSDAEALKNKSELSQKNLEEADKRLQEQLKNNQKTNQEKLDAVVKSAKDAEEKAMNERNKLIFRSLLGLGISCIVAAIVMAVITNGAMLMKSVMLVIGGAMSIGIAQLLSHPLFDLIFGICMVLTFVGVVVYFIYERSDASEKETLKRVVDVLKTSGATNLTVKNDEERDVLLGDLLSSKLDNTHKEVIKDLKKDNEVKKAKMS